MTDDGLVAFLTARLDEDQRVTQAVSPQDWLDSDGWAELDGTVVTHNQRHNPTRVLAEVEAKRQIVEHAERWSATLYEIPGGWSEQGCAAYRMAMEWTLRQLALPYADHPDYREGWKP